MPSSASFIAKARAGNAVLAEPDDEDLAGAVDGRGDRPRSAPAD